MKKRIIVILLILVIISVILGLYGTFATSSSVDATSSATYAITLSNDNSSVSVPAKSSKTIIYRLCNTNKGVVKYGLGYSGTNINVKVYENSIDKETGLINYGENKFIKLYIENTGSNDSTASINTILGYEHGGELIVPSGTTLVTEKYKGIASIYITNLYNSANKTIVTNNNITYNYATSVNLMNDRLGGIASLDAGNIRYYGANPNNYVYFNCREYPTTGCELWRIIGVFDGKLKLIRNESIGTYSWDTSDSSINNGYGVNDWTDADIMKLLNPKYDNENVGGSLYYNAKNGNCYSGTSNLTRACNFTSTGLKNDVTRDIIEQVTWNIGGWNTPLLFANQIYSYERGANVYTGRPIVWTGKVGLMYPSDYGYATDFTNCSKDLYNFNSSNNSYACRSNNWLYNNNYTWLLTPNTANAYSIWRIGADGHLSSGIDGRDAYYIYPTLYLNSKVSITEGTGEEKSPYILGIIPS